MKLHCGTSGFSFKEWKGPFYPDNLQAAEMLGFYSGRLPTVEINNTFYRIPKKSVIAGWRDRVPEDFRFAVKISRRISHFKRLKDCEEPASFFFDAVAELGDRLGCVLVQLPPHFRCDPERLDGFLGIVPDDVPLAFEFRHPSWHDDSVLGLLAAHAAAWVTADDDGRPQGALPATAPWTYLRLRAPAYTDDDLRAWREACTKFDQAFVYFKHETDGAGPALAERMLNLA